MLHRFPYHLRNTYLVLYIEAFSSGTSDSNGGFLADEEVSKNFLIWGRQKEFPYSQNPHLNNGKPRFI